MGHKTVVNLISLFVLVLPALFCFFPSLCYFGPSFLLLLLIIINANERIAGGEYVLILMFSSLLFSSFSSSFSFILHKNLIWPARVEYLDFRAG